MEHGFLWSTRTGSEPEMNIRSGAPSGFEELSSPEWVSSTTNSPPFSLVVKLWQAVFNPPPSYLGSAHLRQWWTFQFLNSCSLLGGSPLPASQRSCVQLIYARRISDVTLDNIEQYVLKWPGPDVFSELHAFTYLTLGSNVPEDIFVRCHALRLKYCGANRKHSPTYADDRDLLARRVTDIKFCITEIYSKISVECASGKHLYSHYL